MVSGVGGVVYLLFSLVVVGRIYGGVRPADVLVDHQPAVMVEVKSDTVSGAL